MLEEDAPGGFDVFRFSDFVELPVLMLCRGGSVDPRFMFLWRGWRVVSAGLGLGDALGVLDVGAGAGRVPECLRVAGFLSAGLHKI